MRSPFLVYRPGRAKDGQGGSITTNTDGVVVWGEFEIHDNKIQIVGVDAREDVRVKDEVEVQE